MIEINLIPSVKRELLKTRAARNRVISLSFLIGGGAIAAVVALSIIFVGQIAAEAVQDGAIKDKNDKLTSITDINKVVTIQNQLSKISDQHAAKKINSRVFDVVSAVNPPDPNNVQFSVIKIEPETKTIKLEGTASNGYEALETLKKTILNTKIKTSDSEETKEVSLTEAIVDGNTSFGENAEGAKVLQFSFSFEYPDELFAVSRGTVTVLTPTSKIDVTDSRLGVPSSLFQDNSSKQEDK